MNSYVSVTARIGLRPESESLGMPIHRARKYDELGNRPTASWIIDFWIGMFFIPPASCNTVFSTEIPYTAPEADRLKPPEFAQTQQTK